MSNPKNLPRIVLTTAARPHYPTLAEAWAVVGPTLARLVAAAIERKKTTRPRRTSVDHDPAEN